VDVSDWERFIDPKTGRAFFHRKSTGTTTWTPPAGIAEAFAKAVAGETDERRDLTAREARGARIIFDHYDADGSGSISITELAAMMREMGVNPTDAQLMKMVSVVDADANGSIEWTEFKAMLEVVSLPTDALTAAADAADAAGEETKMGRAADAWARAGAENEKMRKTRSDANGAADTAGGSGAAGAGSQISPGGRRGPRDLSAAEVKDARAAFAKFDADGSGSIDKDELAAAMAGLGRYPTAEELQAMMVAVDADGSGTVDFDEYCVMISLMPDEDDWEEFEDDATGKPYFRHKTTGEVKWSRVEATQGSSTHLKERYN
jgi:Ca2+-binding EF-hand superfamily protein